MILVENSLFIPRVNILPDPPEIAYDLERFIVFYISLLPT